jgi:hypothetical protein
VWLLREYYLRHDGARGSTISRDQLAIVWFVFRSDLQQIRVLNYLAQVNCLRFVVAGWSPHDAGWRNPLKMYVFK